MSSPIAIKPLYTKLDECLNADRFRLKRRITQLAQKLNGDVTNSSELQRSGKTKHSQKQSQKQQNQSSSDASHSKLKQHQSLQQHFEQLEQDIEASIQKRAWRQENLPQVEYPPLPVSDKKDDIKEAIANNQVVIVAGETGSGKTTQLPKICLELGRGVNGMIAHTQPRRLAARSVATRIAEELNTPLGEKVGFKIRFSDQVSERSYVKLMTDGMLLAEMQQDRFLNQYDTIIIDEAHERSLNIDFLLGYLSQLLSKRPDLKLIITSATIDPERFSKHFNNAPIIEVSGRTYPVEIRYHAPEDNDDDIDQTDAIVNAVDELMREAPGDILVFLSGEREIRDTQDALSKQHYRNTEVVPLYARLTAAEQNRIFQSHSGRRIVLATNVAETSLTVPGIKYVIDPGFARISRYSARSKVQRLPIEPISQASANQRAGRCGRVSDGICIRLYSEDDYLGRPAFTDPEILRTNLASVILQMLALGLGDIAAFPFVQPPDNRNINDGFRLLEEIQAIAKRKGKMQLTPLGRQVARLPIDPRYARMVIEAQRTNALSEVMVIAAGLSIQDPRERPQEKRQQADEKHSEYHDKDSDFISLYNLWVAFREQQNTLSHNQLRKWCKQQFINYLRMREWQDIVSQLKKSIAELGFGITKQEADYQAIHEAIASGLLSHLGFKDKEREYLGSRNTRFLVFPGSGLAKSQPKWVMAAELVETSKLFARMVAKIDPAWIEPLAEHVVQRSYSEPHWSKKRGAVIAFEKVTLFGLPIVLKRAKVYSLIDPPVCHELFIREALVDGNTKLNYGFLQDNQALLEQADEFEQKTRRRDLIVDDEALVSFYAKRIPVDVNNDAAFKKWFKQHGSNQSLTFTEEDVYRQLPEQSVANAFPDVWRQGNITLPLRYNFEPNAEDDGVTVVIPLPVLNQVEDVGFDWLVPGLRHELVVGMIKTLPKRLRRNFVPAPNFAQACLADISETDKHNRPVSIVDAVSDKLRKMTGVIVDSEEWNLALLDKHLKMHFAVVNDNGDDIAKGDDLHALKQKCAGQVKQTFEKAATPELERSNIEAWDFDSLPETFVQKVGGFQVQAFPALVQKGDKVDIALIEEKDKAQRLHKQGVNVLIKNAMPSPLNYLQTKLPNKAKLGLYFNPFGQVKALIDDCIFAGIDTLVNDYCRDKQTDIRTKEEFNACLDVVRANINDKVLEIAQHVEQGLTLAHQCQKQMKGNVPLNMINALGDCKAHLTSLVFPGFVSDIGASKLDDWNRYIKGLARRLEKLPIDPNKDRMHQVTVEKAVSEWEKACSKYPKGKVPEALKDVRWMIEELRVSLFAQQLGTAYPISAKRITLHLNEF
ncbi:ATP-dependent helicase [Alteromonas sp. KUL42]|uniref:ATP-dependent RNA helicase HrpA n=1 Tax=Alteromonas sp. KUL42 TaxID=2480797 RepID=UPI001036B95D|nr:ATP-dependent RNA helicase HrpA [Alteromonas sp. KUL42]TAP34447.1 ATP-dependent RNA helicase HrpA [Alteromonas sp. KUL42]GEA07859.1 ATP-dependent helicase [Alteromonas sp. KUL42]